VAATQGRHATADKIVCRYSTPPAQHKERHVVTLRYEARGEREARDTIVIDGHRAIASTGMKYDMKYDMK